ncbi:putative aldouronate transport system substrate-binding protein [Paenibacillus sp. UNCCL117]|uniref:hypothetical protein n=1 Tax=unclassified Paenibacillus TaxID=185978 RepID=UPI00088DEC72|nr:MULTISPECIES: hypothetical protein [unclassified Paenibacillus]SDE27060.1 putative aldouronate transport system substrate-binding protein [Paenibacillus sp. cl123]SFW62753.1 putative aldouronate transport system substrate-binding protein [Paenibacillus sp. UNCCL117]
MKKKRSSLLITMAICSLVCGCKGDALQKGEAEAADRSRRLVNLNAAGFPIVKEPIRLTFFAHKSNSNSGNWNEALVWKEYARMTNIDVDFQLTSIDVLPEKRNLVLASGEHPDAFHTALLPASDLITYGSQGVLIPLNDLIDKYAPKRPCGSCSS